MEAENNQLANRILKEFYEKNMSQKEIACIEHVSKSTVSRIISRAKEDGSVRIELKLAGASAKKTEEALRKAFGLEEVHVCPEILPDPDSRMRDVVRSLAKDLPRLLQNNDILALGCGREIELLAELLPRPDPVPEGIRIVQACGMPDTGRSWVSLCRQLCVLAEKLCGALRLFPVPVLLHSAELAEQLREDPAVSQVLALAEEADVGIFTAGGTEEKNVLARNRMLGKAQFGNLIAEGAEGDVLFHFLNREGTLTDPELDRRTMSIPLEKLKRKRLRILAAAGEERAESILSVLRSGIPNRLYIDERSARRVLELI